MKSKKLFNNSEQCKNATLVQYADNKIFAIGHREARLHILDLKLRTLKVVDHKFEEWINVMKSSNLYIGVGEETHGNVTVFDHNGNRVLVSYF